MEKSPSLALSQQTSTLLSKAAPWIIFSMGIWLVVIKPLGTHWEFVPGDLGDARFNNYILEHFVRWLSGADLSYWDAPFFYPFRNVIAFSDNLLGSAFFYAGFRWAGLDMETAYQGWSVLGFVLNYAAALYVLSRLKFHPLAVSLGAFFFTFGLPLLAQESHAQLLYRFGIPLTCLFFWQFFEEPKLGRLAVLLFWFVWQFYLTIYLGVFLSMLLLAFGIALPFTIPSISFKERLAVWPRKFMQAWSDTTPVSRILSMLALTGLGACFFLLMQPYFSAAKHYGLSRSWYEISTPGLQEYLWAFQSQIWEPISRYFTNSSNSTEQQLFPGLAVILLIISGLAAQLRSKAPLLARVNLWVTAALILLTLNFNGNSAYWLFWNLPGLKSIRAVGRIELVLMWPIAVYITWAAHELLQQSLQKSARFIWVYFLILGLLIAESTFFSHHSYSKPDAQRRLVTLEKTIPVSLPQNPILFMKDPVSTEFDYIQELDAMLVAQHLSMPTLNGYSGNTPPGYQYSANCTLIPKRLSQYIKFENITRKLYYQETMDRVVPVGFQDCDPNWWKSMP